MHIHIYFHFHPSLIIHCFTQRIVSLFIKRDSMLNYNNEGHLVTVLGI